MGVSMGGTNMMMGKMSLEGPAGGDTGNNMLQEFDYEIGRLREENN